VPLYGFGYGLSYTTFKYDALAVPTVVKRGNKVTVTVAITNTGKMAGDEVAQLYLTYNNNAQKTPIKALKGFNRISLKAGERKLVTFTLSAADLSVPNANGKITPLKGRLTLSVGGSQPDEKNLTSGNIVKRTVTMM
jgi:beta-glucosidase